MIPVADAIDADTLRIRHEFLTLSGLCTSADACAHLLNVSPRHATHLLDSLVREGFLQRVDKGAYRRSSPLPAAT